mmetsp:Transcript_5336/g.8407  ORF Transcript_5336/g.8407 Transcript_5336/m.8407 type:complete len:84 (-) Transcript_5336:492-743(-)
MMTPSFPMNKDSLVLCVMLKHAACTPNLSSHVIIQHIASSIFHICIWAFFRAPRTVEVVFHALQRLIRREGKVSECGRISNAH